MNSNYNKNSEKTFSDISEYCNNIYDSIVFKFGKVIDCNYKGDSLLYFSIQEPKVYKYVTKVEHDFVNKTDLKHIVAYEKKIDSTFHLCFNLNSRNLTLIDITPQIQKSKWLIGDSLLKQIKKTVPNLMEVYPYNSDTLFLLYSKPIVYSDTLKHKNKMDLSTSNYPCIGFYINSKFKSLPHGFDGYIKEVYFNDLLGCGFVHYIKFGKSNIVNLGGLNFQHKAIEIPFYAGDIKYIECKYYFGFRHDYFTAINELGEILGCYSYKI
jgi:hypothetical protein